MAGFVLEGFGYLPEAMNASMAAAGNLKCLIWTVGASTSDKLLAKKLIVPRRAASA